MNSSHAPALKGLLCAVLAYLTWGLSPIYFKALAEVPAFEILMHRMIWSFLFLVPLIVIFKRWKHFKQALKSRTALSVLFFTTFLVGSNWFLFIWAINNNHILETSLGYYICPLVSVFLGTVFLKERLRPLQLLAIILAAAGVIYMAVFHGVFPWVALILAFTFALYGLIRKIAPVEALEGLTVETLLLSFPAALYLIYLYRMDAGALFHMNSKIDLLLMGTALVTALPLLLFNLGARRLQLSTIGFLQYMAPSCTFILAVFIYREPFTPARLVAFVMIWSALAIFSFDALRFYRRPKAATDPIKIHGESFNS
jgi:chloramphenicol-sensitive protein RarD